jgi:K+-transporting ATPase ATPase C chain
MIMSDLITSLRLFVLSLVVCSAGYSGLMLGFAAVVNPEGRQGSLISRDGTVVGSQLIAQNFTRPEYFWPRPSACGYDASATAGSNWGPTNPLLRDRVARQLGPIVIYAAGDKKGQPVGPDIEGWFQEQRSDFVAQWASGHADLAEKWLKDHPDGVATFLGMSSDDVKANTGETSKTFFAQFTDENPGAWPVEEEVATSDGKTERQIKPAREGTDIQGYFFALWLQAHPGVELQKVPADLVMASGGGMDPHITLAAALFQAQRVAAARNWSVEQVKKLIDDHTDSPTLVAFGGEPVVNVLRLNVELDAQGGRGE